jgi:hypothetical protein
VTVPPSAVLGRVEQPRADARRAEAGYDEQVLEVGAAREARARRLGLGARPPDQHVADRQPAEPGHEVGRRALLLQRQAQAVLVAVAEVPWSTCRSSRASSSRARGRTRTGRGFRGWLPHALRVDGQGYPGRRTGLDVNRRIAGTRARRPADNWAVGALLRVVCWVVGHRWRRGVQSFGHTLWHCGRCRSRRYALRAVRSPSRTRAWRRGSWSNCAALWMSSARSAAGGPATGARRRRAR